MPANAILIRIDADSSKAMIATSAYEKSLARLDAQLTVAARRQTELDAALRKSGAGSDAAIAAQAKYDAALKRTTVAQDQLALAAKRSSEVQAAAAQKAAAASEAAAAKQAAAMKTVGTVFGVVGAAAAAGLAVAAKAAADFNAKMAQVRTLSGASASQIQALTKAAGGFTNIGLSATDAADAMIELTKAGISVKDQLGGALAGTLNLAAAGQTDVATATQIAAVAMTQFKLNASGIPHVADLLAAGADRALGSVTDLGYGLSQAGLPAHNLGVSLDQTVATLAEFAQAGLIGEKGGTTLKQMFLRLENPTAAADAALKKYNISLYDSQGNFVGMTKLAGELHDNLQGLTLAQREQTLATIFGSRAIQGANVLYQDGAAGATKWQKAVEQSGFAAHQAQGKMDSFSGDLQKLGAVIQDDLISAGQQLQPMLRAITQGLTAVGNAAGLIPDPIKQVGVEMAVGVAALGLGVFAFTRLKAAAVSLAETLGVLAAAQVEVGATATAMAAEETAAAGATARAGGAAGLAGRFNKGTAGRLGGSLALGLGGSYVGQNYGGTAAGSIGSGALNGAALGLLLGPEGAVIGAALGSLLAGAKYAAAHPGPPQNAQANPFNTAAPAGPLNFGSNQAMASGRMQGILALDQHPFQVSTAQSAKVMDELGMSAAAVARDIKSTSVGIGSAALSFGELKRQASNAWAAMQQLDQATLSRRGDWRSYQQAIDDASAALKQNGKTLNTNTQAGRDNQASLDNIAASAASYATTLSDPVLRLKFLESSRAQLERTAQSFGMGKVAAKNYADQVLGIPKQWVTAAAFEKNQAANDVATYKAAIDKVPGFKNTVITAQTQQAEGALLRTLGLLGAIHSKTVWVNVVPGHSGAQAYPASGGYISHGKLHRYADGGSFPYGGYIRGPGTGTSDSIPAMISNGEFVMKAAAVERYGVSVMHAINQMRAPLPFAAGGNAWHANGAMYDRMTQRSVGAGGSSAVPGFAAALDGLRQEIAGVRATLTDGSQRANVNNPEVLDRRSFQLGLFAADMTQGLGQQMADMGTR